MFRIKYIPETQKYQIHSKYHGAFEGTLTQITYKALEMGVINRELTLAYEVMDKNQDTIAEFGINGCFLFSKKAA